MNWLYIVTMAYIVLSALRGFHKGFLRVVYSMAALLITVVFVASAAPVIKNMLQKYTPVEQWLTAACENEELAAFCMSVAAFAASLVIIWLILLYIGRKLDLFAKTPGIHIINMILGFIAGTVKAFIVIWLVFLIIKITSAVPSSASLIKLIEENDVLRSMYDQNRLLELLQKMSLIKKF